MSEFEILNTKKIEITRKILRFESADLMLIKSIIDYDTTDIAVLKTVISDLTRVYNLFKLRCNGGKKKCRNYK